MATVVAGGAWRVADARLTREGELLTVGLIQGNIAQEDKWDPRQAPRIVSAYERLTREAVARGAEYVVWPESSTPFMFEEDPVGEAAVRSLVREVGVPLLIGSEKLEVTDRPRLYNAAFMLDADGSTSAVYRKIQLVPFGEFVPFKSWLTFVSPLVERMTDFAPGDTVTPLPVGDATVTTAICYEVVYPALAREAVRAGSQLLTTITNDAWYGHSSAPYQHFSLARMRAIEEGRYLVRAANTGISGIVDPYGRVTTATALFEEVAVVGDVRLLQAQTLYARLGDLVAYVSLALLAATWVVGRRVAGFRRHSGEEDTSWQ